MISYSTLYLMRGLLYHLKLGIKNNRLKTMKVVYATPLKDKSGKKLKYKFRDSEGLSIVNGDNGKRGDSKLIISFEKSAPHCLLLNKG